MESTIDTYGRHRLLTFDRDPSTREPTVEVAHEALLSAWESLRGWIDEAREDLRTHRRLSEAAHEWERSGPEPSFLLTGSRLEQFDSWASTTSLALGPGERGYLVASLARRDTERTAEAARGERERGVERRSVKRLRALAAVLIVAALVAATLTAVALDQTAKARRASGLAVARELAAAAVANLDVDHQLAILLALRALRTDLEAEHSLDPRVEEVLRRAAPTLRIDTSPILGTGIRTTAFTSDGTRVAIVGRDGSVGVWDLRNGSRTLAIDPPQDSCVPAVACPVVFKVDLSDDASFLATGDGEGLAHVWKVGSAHEILTVPTTSHPPLTNSSSTTNTFGGLGEGAAPQVALSPDGRLLATAASDGAVRIWDVATGQQLLNDEVCGPGTEVFCAPVIPGILTFSPDETRLFLARFDGRRGSVVDITTGTTFPLPPHQFRGVMNADGSQLAYMVGYGRRTPQIEFFGADRVVLARFRENDVRLDAGENDAHLDEIQMLQGHTLPISSGRFSADGTRFATGSLDGTARVWDTSTAELIFTSPVEPSDVAAVAFSPDGSRVTAVYSDGRVIVYPISLGDTIELAEARVTRGLTAEECRRYLHVPNCPAD